MKKVVLFFIFICSISTSTMSFANTEKRRSQLINVIDQELREVTKINRNSNGKNPDIMLRMAELLLEKARHLKARENERYLKLPPKKRRQVNKKKVFSRSRKYFIQAQKTCRHILKKFPDFDGRADVLYILAYNAKEFQREDDAKRYFTMATKRAKSGSQVKAKSQLALGEIHYNDENYNQAIPLYEEALEKINDKWWTKDAFNLAWSYFRVERYNKATSLMEKVYDRSQNKKYIDMSYSVKRDIAYFYTEMGEVDKAVNFYKKTDDDIGKNLIKVGRHLVNQGKFTSAEKVFRQSLNYTSGAKEKAEVHHKLLSLYDKYGKVGKHLKSARVLTDYYKKGILNKSQVEDLKYHVQKMSSTLQQQVVKEGKGRNKAEIRRKAKRSSEYYDLLTTLAPEKNYVAAFNSAETFFASGNYDDAVRKYDIAFKGAKKKGDQKIKKRSLEGLLASLGSDGISKKVENQYLETAYLAYLNQYPDKKQSDKIFQRLFNKYISEKNINKAERTLNSYKKHFPQKHDKHEAMLGKIMDHYKAKGNRQGIQKWVKKINGGEFKLSKGYVKQLQALLLTMQFENVEEASSKGDKKAALKGYVQIYKSDRSSDEAKKNAAYNIATLFHELGDPERTYGWAKWALSHMEADDVKEFESSFISIASGLFNRRKFSEAAEINERSYNKLCRKSSKNKRIFFKNANIIYLADGQHKKARGVIDSAKRCNVPRKVKREAKSEYLSYLVSNEYWNTLNKYIKTLRAKPSWWPELLYPMGKVRDALKDSGRSIAQKNQEILSLYRKCKSRGMDIPLEGLDIVANIRMKSLKSEFEKLKSIELTYPEKTYNERLQTMFNQLDTVTTKALDILSIGSGDGIVRSYRYLVQAYEYVGNKVSNFRPEGKSHQYIQSFKKSMKDITAPLFTKAREFRNEALGHIRKDDILSVDNYWFLNNSTQNLQLRYEFLKGSVLMDRGGRK